jgi:hypothetical protein
MASLGIEPVNFQFVAQCPNELHHCVTPVKQRMELNMQVSHYRDSQFNFWLIRYKLMPLLPFMMQSLLIQAAFFCKLVVVHDTS